MKLTEILPENTYRWSEEKVKGGQAWKVFTTNMRHVLNVELVDDTWYVSTREPLSKFFRTTDLPVNMLGTGITSGPAQVRKVLNNYRKKV